MEAIALPTSQNTLYCVASMRNGTCESTIEDALLFFCVMCLQLIIKTDKIPVNFVHT